VMINHRWAGNGRLGGSHDPSVIAAVRFGKSDYQRPPSTSSGFGAISGGSSPVAPTADALNLKMRRRIWRQEY